MPTAVVTAREADVPALAGALARAFYDDPLMSWFLPNDDRRLGVLEGTFAVTLRKVNLRRGHEVYTTEERATCAIWVPPDQWKLQPVDLLRTVPGMIAAYRRDLRDLPGALPKMMGTFRLMEKKHPHEPHWYLQGLGTDPAFQRRGLASSVMRPVLDRCDVEGLPAYLETQKEENVPFYARHGFAVRDEIDLPKGGPHLWLMWREPANP